MRIAAWRQTAANQRLALCRGAVGSCINRRSTPESRVACRDLIRTICSDFPLSAQPQVAVRRMVGAHCRVGCAPRALRAGRAACGPAPRCHGRSRLCAGAPLPPWRPRLGLGWPLACATAPRSWRKTTIICCSKGQIRPCAPPSVSALSVLPGRRDGGKSGFRMPPRAKADYRHFLPREGNFVTLLPKREWLEHLFLYSSKKKGPEGPFPICG